jgi:uncharacterized membrane protein YkvA (DUF1232 family)
LPNGTRGSALTAEAASLVHRLKLWASALMRDVVAIWLAARDPRVPWLAKAVALCIAAYALSPIDLIPDFIPVLGYLDDLIIVPLGIMIVVRMIPEALMAEFRLAASTRQQRPKSAAGAIIVLAFWLAAAALLARWFWPDLLK